MPDKSFPKIYKGIHMVFAELLEFCSDSLALGPLFKAQPGRADKQSSNKSGPPSWRHNLVQL